MTVPEIGGYFELERPWGEHFHRNALALNSGRGCILYLSELRHIQSVWVPDFMCDSVWNAFERAGCKLKFYHIGMDFRPIYDFDIAENEWMFLCDYYGQLCDDDLEDALNRCSGRLLVDKTQAFYSQPSVPCDVMYTCRKWFGVPDGGYVQTKDNARLAREIPCDESRDRMDFVLGRVERGAKEFFSSACANNELFEAEPTKTMSALTDRMMRGIDYCKVAVRRRENWQLLHESLGALNGLCLETPEVPFMYPLLVGSSAKLRSSLIANRVYVPTLWPNVVQSKDAGVDAFNLASNIIPLPIDQRYGKQEMQTIVSLILDNLE